MNLGLIGAWYTELLTQLPLVEDPKTAAFTLLATDSGKIINCSGTFAIQFPSVKALATNWATIIQNTSTGALTVTPFGTETVDAKSTYVMYGSEARLYYRGATEIKSIVLSGFDHTITTVGANTFVTPPGYTTFEGEIWPAGNSGAKGLIGGVCTPGGGGAGGFPFVIPAASFAASETVTIGAGGAAVSVANTGGNVGGATSIGTLLATATAGSYVTGACIATNAVSLAQGTGFESGSGQAVAAGHSIWGGTGSANGGATAISGNSIYGGGTGGGINNDNTTVVAPGTSKFGGNGGAASVAGAATAGTAPGGGGGATITGTSGAGARGEVRIRGKV